MSILIILLSTGYSILFTGSRGNLSILLRLYSRTDRRAMKYAVAGLLRQTLSTTPAFQHDAEEIDLWLTALPSTARPPEAHAHDNTPLTNEAEAVILLLDDCFQRCLKTPYRYVEELQALCHPGNGKLEGGDPHVLPSPMLVTVLEQIQAKVNGNLLSPSDTLAAITFVRKLMLQMASKLPSLQPLDAVANRIRSLSLDSQHLGASVHAAIVREQDRLSACRYDLTAVSSPEAKRHNDSIAELMGQFQTKALGMYHSPSMHSCHQINIPLLLVCQTMTY